MTAHQCQKCRDSFSSADDLEQHFIDAKHSADPDYPLYCAKVQYELAVELHRRSAASLTAAKAAYREARHDAHEPTEQES